MALESPTNFAIVPKSIRLVVLMLLSIYVDLNKSEFYILADTRFWIRYTRPVIGWVVHLYAPHSKCWILLIGRHIHT